MNLKRTFTAYLAATVSVIAPSYVVCWLLVDLGYRVAWLKLAAIAWCAIVGIPSMLYASAQLHKILGHKPPVRVDVMGGRNIPVFADSVAWARGKTPATSLRVADELAFRQGNVAVSQTEMRQFLHRAWRRQQLGKAPLARLAEVPRHMAREEYECVVSVLVGTNCIHGTRGRGSKNRMRWAPEITLSELRHRYS